jgi:hypothetical protein
MNSLVKYQELNTRIICQIQNLRIHIAIQNNNNIKLTLNQKNFS